jgi:hypothetical protein
MSDKAETPETDAKALVIISARQNERLVLWQVYGRKIERERDELRDQLRAMVNAKGRYNTQIAMETLIGLLPENKTS